MRRYCASDASGNTACVNRTIITRDTIPPVFSAELPAAVSLQPGEQFVLPNITAVDSVDGAVPVNMTVYRETSAGKFELATTAELVRRNDGSRSATYRLCFSSTDASGSQSSECQLVTLLPSVATTSSPDRSTGGDGKAEFPWWIVLVVLLLLAVAVAAVVAYRKHLACFAEKQSQPAYKTDQLLYPNPMYASTGTESNFFPTLNNPSPSVLSNATYEGADSYSVFAQPGQPGVEAWSAPTGSAYVGHPLSQGSAI